ncbi:RHS repeat domain-containing protein [Streptomyces sp. NPDC093990]|uniref:RHS repeat domain-containing protein n=1 Tax=Streptomyces sp. NPDC093990 TaxID=3155306 RepID=UPI003412B954
MGRSVTRTYDAYGNLTSETDPLGNKATWTYDRVGRAVRAAVPPLIPELGVRPVSGCGPSEARLTRPRRRIALPGPRRPSGSSPWRSWSSASWSTSSDAAAWSHDAANTRLGCAADFARREFRKSEQLQLPVRPAKVMSPPS